MRHLKLPIRAELAHLGLSILSGLLVFAACEKDQAADGTETHEHHHDDEDITIPDDFKGKENPYGPDDDAAVSAGKKLYTEQCADCHGTKGKGDGPDAADLEHECPSLISDEVAKWEDDFFYYRVFVGEDEHGMPSFEKDLGTKKVWQVISYVRTLQDG